jgi:hypothetical protein
VQLSYGKFQSSGKEKNKKYLSDIYHGYRLKVSILLKYGQYHRIPLFFLTINRLVDFLEIMMLLGGGRWQVMLDSSVFHLIGLKFILFNIMFSGFSKQYL